MAASLGELEAVYRARQRQLVRIAWAITGDREQAVDAVQDAFVRAVRRRTTFRGDGSLDAWVAKIVISAAHDVARREADEPAGTDTVVLGADAALMNGDLADARLRALIRALPERQRLALFLRHYADFDYRQIAEALGIARGTVSATLHAAHHELARRLEEVVR